jgi:hypothetical protein
VSGQGRCDHGGGPGGGRPRPGEPSYPNACDGCGAAQLSPDARRFLDEHSGLGPIDFARAAAAERENSVRVAAHMTRLLEASLSVEQTAEALAVDVADVHAAANSRHLYTWTARDGCVVLPRWQFDETAHPWRPLPYLGAVLSALPNDLHPLEADWFMTQPREWLVGDDEEPMSVRDWLLTGGDVAPVLHGSESLHVFG